ncbi:MAG: alpha/beta hydrolase [Chloroflexi bacterium GWB2_49_20]|nr:MAG: alpha/beta hydrolase [Chloroflexi bacterium GWB2_49_20]OGN79114.1 MAG: alpha/beta hydrolase [Chloroflexi bacterium GWC2_49_37]OGN84910.1 MAG: alpha/beta hydrolase [Chloroflexi bacterium GWD2_49_16]HCC78029.1 alpha/beta hydrolase [Anaerolineae bacterium]HCM96619.1 alpha/beta hydrolase [Anaerolineae bacterium]
MPNLKINGASIYYEEHGSGAETLVFSHGLLWSGAMFKDQVTALKDRFRCITYDHRGQGQSEVTQSGYDIESLYKDSIALIEALDCAPCHFVGLSMGGFVGLRLGIRRPDLLKSLTLIESSSDPESMETARSYRMLNIVARWIGLQLVADRVMQIMFGQKFLNDPGRASLKQEWKQRMVANDRVGITRAVSGVITRQGVTEQLGQIKTPTLIIVGDQDVATVPRKAEQMHAGIPNSQLVIIPGAGHTSTLEEPEAVTAAMEAFLKSQAG